MVTFFVDLLQNLFIIVRFWVFLYCEACARRSLLPFLIVGPFFISAITFFVILKPHCVYIQFFHLFISYIPIVMFRKISRVLLSLHNFSSCFLDAVHFRLWGSMAFFGVHYNCLFYY